MSTRDHLAAVTAAFARTVGGMVLTSHDSQFDETPERVLLDLEAMNGRELLEKFHKRHAKYGTAPFDPQGELLRFYPGGVTIWSGFPGSGKTTLLRQTVCHILARGSSVFLASLEEDPADVLVKLAGTAAGGEPDSHQVQWFIDEFAKRFRLWGKIGIASHTELLAVTRQCAAHGIRHAVIDSLMCLDVANDDFEAQRRFANLLAATARVANIHIHLVAHPRKLISSNQEPDLNDVAGAREIGGIADNVLFVRRTAAKTDYGPDSEVTPMCVSIRKQRHFNGALVDVQGYFDRRHRQFVKDQWAGPARYLPADAYRGAA